MITIGYIEIEAIVAAMSGLENREMIRRRFKYLQRMSYPPNSNTGRGRKAMLDLEQVLQVIVALELMQVGASPTRAIRILRTNWEELLPALALGWLASRTPALGPFRDLLVMNAGAFEDVGRSENPYEPVLQPFHPMSALDLLEDMTLEGSTTRVILDPVRLVSYIIYHSQLEVAGFSEEDLDSDFAKLWNATHKLDPDDWVAEAVKVNRPGQIEVAIGDRLSSVPPRSLNISE